MIHMLHSKDKRWCHAGAPNSQDCWHQMSVTCIPCLKAFLRAAEGVQERLDELRAEHPIFCLSRSACSCGREK